MGVTGSSASGAPRWTDYVPAFGALRGYRLRHLGSDTLAGLTVAALAVPQAMAYALLAGLPAHYGLYGAIVITVVGALFDSSRQLINGPTNAISIAVLSALALVPEGERVTAAITLAALVGLIQLAIWALRLGDVTRFLSHAVISGFTVGATALLALGQLPVLLGAKAVGARTDHALERFWRTMTEGGAHGWTVALGLGTIALVLALRWVSRRIGRRIPDLLIAVIVAAGVVSTLELADQGVRVVGAIPRELPSFALPDLSWSLVSTLAGSATAIAVLGLLEALAMAKSLAQRSGQRLDVRQQCLSEAAANLVGGFFQCFPGSGSLTRSSINLEAGAVSQWSGVVSAAAVAGTILAFAPLAEAIPQSSLAAILLLAGWRMVDRHALLYNMRAGTFDRRIVVVTAVSAVAISIEFCILIGALASLVLYMPRATRVLATDLVVTAQRSVREKREGDPPCTRVRIVDLEGELFFGAAPDLERHLDAIEEDMARSRARVLILRLRRVRNPDAMCVHLIDEAEARLTARGVTVFLCGVRAELETMLKNVGVADRLGDRLLGEHSRPWTSTLESVRRAYALLGDDLCPACPRRAEKDPSMAGWVYEI
ncbi:MAG: putative sulfate transporter [Myxococcales bacterium]